MRAYFGEIFSAFVGLLKGLRVTFLTMLKPAITVQYPTEKLVPYEGFRGVLLYDAEACIACNLCAKACPSACIQVEPAKNEQGRRIAKAAWYSIDFGKCNFCRLCEEACASKPRALWHSLDYELVFFRREEMVRYWKQGFDYLGKVAAAEAGEFKEPEGQVRIQSVPGRCKY
ncbi:MAG: NADH-quinone oxidoreductase subunit I [Elusimicrobiota bacterium]